MSKKNILNFAFLIFFSCFALAQENDFEFIEFEYAHSMRIPFNNVKIEIQKEKDSAIVKVFASAANTDNRWNYSRINKTYKISPQNFEEIKFNLHKLNTLTFPESLNGMDGFSCSIKFNKGNENFNYSFWCPNCHDKNQNIEYFLNICKEIVVLGRLNPKEIFANKNE